MKKSHAIEVLVKRQKLVVRSGGDVVREFPISTSRYGLGFKSGSHKTPTGRFRVTEKIGGGMPLNTVFKSRQPLPPNVIPSPDEDAIMSRILWLDGLGKRNANTRSRYIYIHGTNHERDIGRPASHGCVRMRNRDIANLFELVEVGTEVKITP